MDELRDAAHSPECDPPSSYWERRAELAAVAGGVDAPPVDVEYLDVEHETWATVSTALRPLWERHAASGVLAARDALGLPGDHIPQLREVDAWLEPITGFGYRAVPGILPGKEFFGALARRRFPSTQYVRWHGAPTYTPEPDVIHEVMGHANCLACPEIAELHRLAGEAATRIEHDDTYQLVADVFWYTVEFGVVRDGGDWKAYGAGLLSSPGELDWFGANADIRPLDIQAMGRQEYDIHHYQPVLFGGRSLGHVLEVVGGFFERVTDDVAHELLAAS